MPPSAGRRCPRVALLLTPRTSIPATCASTTRNAVSVRNQHPVDILSAFSISTAATPRAEAPALGVASLQLHFPNGYVTGIVASRNYDRFLSYGVNLGQFQRGTWYRVPLLGRTGPGLVRPPRTRSLPTRLQNLGQVLRCNTARS